MDLTMPPLSGGTSSSPRPFVWPLTLFRALEDGFPWDRGALAVCVQHRGQHVYAQGCVAFREGIRKPLRVDRCDEEGCRLPLYVSHQHPQRLVVQMDEDGLASAIVRASAAARQQRRDEAVKETGAALPRVPSLKRPDADTYKRYEPLPPAAEEEKAKSGGFEP